MMGKAETKIVTSSFTSLLSWKAGEDWNRMVIPKTMRKSANGITPLCGIAYPIPPVMMSAVPTPKRSHGEKFVSIFDCFNV